jgi:trans-2-enoyl-CoA reductase
MPKWDEDDIEELNNTLKKYVTESLKEKEKVEIRIDYCQLVRDTSPTIKNIWEEIENSRLS